MKFKVESPKISCRPLSKYEPIKTWTRGRKKFLKTIGNFVYDNTQHKFIPMSKYAKQLSDMDLAYEYFDVCVFDMSTSILIREFFYTFNEYKAKWATTQRYSTEKCFTLSNEAFLINPLKQIEAIYNFMELTEKFNKGELSKFDGVREHMPLSFKVNYQFCMSKKQFVKCLAVLAKLVGVDSPLFREVYMATYKNKCLRDKLNHIDKYCNELDEFTKYDLKETDEKDITCGMVLYSQLIRHEGVTCKGYWNFIRSYCHSSDYSDCSSEFPIKIDWSESRRAEIIRIRTSWFAVTDDWYSNNTWACLLRKYITEENPDIDNYKWMFSWFSKDGEFVNNLGVHGLDDNFRLHKGYKAYFPNAFILESRDLVEQRIKREGVNPLLRMYLQMFDKGYIKDNPNNPYRIKWEKLSNGD